MMSPDQEARLTGGGDCFDHYHSADRQVTHDTLDALIALETYKEVVHADSPYTIRPGLDYVLANSSSGAISITLPDPALGLTAMVIKTTVSHTVTISTPSGTINGAATYVLNTAYSIAAFKALGGNYYVTSK